MTDQATAESARAPASTMPEPTVDDDDAPPASLGGEVDPVVVRASQSEPELGVLAKVVAVSADPVRGGMGGRWPERCAGSQPSSPVPS